MPARMGGKRSRINRIRMRRRRRVMGIGLINIRENGGPCSGRSLSSVRDVPGLYPHCSYLPLPSFSVSADFKRLSSIYKLIRINTWGRFLQVLILMDLQANIIPVQCSLFRWVYGDATERT